MAPVLYPAPPDTARVQFLTHITSERDLGRRRSVLSQVVGEQEKVRIIAKPYGLGIYRDRLYVCDENIGGVDIVDLAQRTITFFQPREPQAIRRAVNCSLDGDGNLYVTDLGSRQVLAFDSAGAFLRRFGAEDGGNPADVMVAGDRIFVSHLDGKPRIRVHDRATGEMLYGFPDAEPADSIGVAAPVNLFVRGDEVYVSDMLKQQVFVYSTDGAFRRTIGRPGLGPSTFSRPKGVAADRDGLVYVVDGAFDNVQVFDPSGRLLMFFGGPGETPGSMVLPAKVVLDYEHVDRFRDLVAPGYALKYLIFVTNQFGPWRINVYGFVEPSPGSGPSPGGRR